MNPFQAIHGNTGRGLGDPMDDAFVSKVSNTGGGGGSLDLSISANRLNFFPGNRLTVSLTGDNPGMTSIVDFYFGVVLPDGDTVVYFKDLAFNTGQGSLSNISILTPILAGVNLSSPFVVNEPSFFSFRWSGGEPRGSYTMFLIAVVPGAFADGAINDGDIVATSTAAFTFTP